MSLRGKDDPRGGEWACEATNERRAGLLARER
jgi:hypothetical protein